MGRRSKVQWSLPRLVLSNHPHMPESSLNNIGVLVSDIDRQRPDLGLIMRNKSREDDPSFGSLVNSHRSIGTLPWTPTSKVQIRLQKVRVLLQNDHRGRKIDFKYWWSTSLDWSGPT